MSDASSSAETWSATDKPRAGIVYDKWNSTMIEIKRYELIFLCLLMFPVWCLYMILTRTYVTNFQVLFLQALGIFVLIGVTIWLGQIFIRTFWYLFKDPSFLIAEISPSEFKIHQPYKGFLKKKNVRILSIDKIEIKKAYGKKIIEISLINGSVEKFSLDTAST